MYLQQALMKQLLRAHGRKIILYKEQNRQFCQGQWLVRDDKGFSVQVEEFERTDIIIENERGWAEIYLHCGVCVVPVIIVKKENDRVLIELNGQLYLHQMRNISRIKYIKPIRFTLISFRGKVFVRKISPGIGLLDNISPDGLAFKTELDLPIGIVMKIKVDTLPLNGVTGCILWKKRDKKKYVYGLRIIMPPDEYKKLKEFCDKMAE